MTITLVNPAALSVTINVTGVSAPIEPFVALTEKKTPPRTPGLGITPGVNDVTVYGGVPPDIVNSATSVAAEHVRLSSQIVAEGGATISATGAGGAVTVTLAVTVLPSESTIVIVALPPVPVVLAVKDVPPTVIGLPPKVTIVVLLEYTLNDGNPPMILNEIGTLPDTAIVLGLTASEDDAGVTVTVVVVVAPTLSCTVIGTAVLVATGLGFTVKVFPDTLSLGITAVLVENMK